METDNQRKYRLNINGYKDKRVLRRKIQYRLESRRTKFLLSLPVERLLTEVGYYETSKI